MLKRFLQKIFASVQHSKHGRHRYSSNDRKPHYGRRNSSDQGHGHNNQGHNYYKNKYKSSS
ncbi:MAG: hypothetical protein K0Q59_601 [Paenibacillus sp.]|nr:hypothetical protein [Paenibacillus sp.]